jgi:hypothetical protein
MLTNDGMRSEKPHTLEMEQVENVVMLLDRINARAHHEAGAELSLGLTCQGLKV